MKFISARVTTSSIASVSHLLERSAPTLSARARAHRLRTPGRVRAQANERIGLRVQRTLGNHSGLGGVLLQRSIHHWHEGLCPRTQTR